MRVRDHVVLSTAAAALLSPWAGRGALGLWAGGVLIDADHYVWFCWERRRLNLLAAVRFFNGSHPPQHSATRFLHTPLALMAFLLVGLRHRRLLPVALGMGLHVALDEHHEARMGEARAAAMERDGFSCRGCGSRAPQLAAHIWRQPWLLPSYEAQNLISLCGQCHEVAHTRGMGAQWWS